MTMFAKDGRVGRKPKDTGSDVFCGPKVHEASGAALPSWLISASKANSILGNLYKTQSLLRQKMKDT
jgi:hypothetical protein